VATESRETLKALVVERDPDEVTRLIEQLEAAGYRLDHRVVHQAEEARAALMQRRWDLVVSDYQLSDFTVLELLAWIQGAGLDLPVIVLATGIGEELAAGAMRAGAHDYISKRNRYRLVPAIERELAEIRVHREYAAAERALEESRERFRQLVENIDEVFWLIDCERMRILYLSESYETLWELPRRTLESDISALLDSVHPEDFNRVSERLEEKGWAGLNLDYRIQRPDGSERWVRTSSFPIRDSEGRVYRVAGLSIDITAQKRAEMEMRTMIRALEQTADAVLIANAQGQIEYVNLAFERITGYRREEVIGRNPRLLKSGLQDERFYNRMWESMRSGLAYTDVFINRRKNGDLYYDEQTITPVRNAEGEMTHFVSTGKDITERLRREQRLHSIVHYDAVTNLPNRILFAERLREAVRSAKRKQSMAGLLRLKVEIFELLGEGQRQLAEQFVARVAERLREHFPERITVACLGGEEFAIIYRDVGDAHSMDMAAQEVIGLFQEPISWEGYTLFVTTNVGISLYPRDGEGPEELVQCAEIAMQQAHAHGPNDYLFFNPTMRKAGV